ncbi:MFS general substrate transporter [Rickenella mellea]|uniref:MFS general substrate transporter n=1 Tax=Rickenella mellea TaxID=50990 RepID=A0A4Y7PX95_9AGAM|nr:MFS general substrate transporter [Rickenella mellea]
MSSGQRTERSVEIQPVVEYRLYKARFWGVTGIVILNIVGGMNWTYFGPISTEMVNDFGITLDQNNWLGNIIALTYIVFAPFVPVLRKRLGLRTTCMIGTATLILASWVRYAGTARSLPVNGAYALLIIGQFFSALSQAIFQIIGPIYSQTWFDLQGRTTATMVMSIANPIGGALGQLISPIPTHARPAILILGIVCTVFSPVVFLIKSEPPTPPTYAGSQPTPHMLTMLRALIGKQPLNDHHASLDSRMTIRERIDFVILTLLFGTLVAATNAYSIQSSQLLEPYGYSENTAGFMGAALLLSGIVAAIVTAPLFDRVMTHHLAFTARIFCPVIAALWLSLIWAVKPNNTAALYAIFVLIGVCSVSMLPVGLELGCELTRSADGSSAILWWSGNLLGIIFVLVEAALRAGVDARPPQNMHRALIFQGAFVVVACSTVLLLRGKQRRREMDVQKFEEYKAGGAQLGS